MKRFIEVILCIFVGVFLFGIIAIAFQVIGEDSPNKASIIGGILSMIGGALGALGAYIVATYQMNKQFENHEKNRALELKVNKSNTALNKLVELKEFVHKIKGELTNMEVEVSEKILRRGLRLLHQYNLVDGIYRDQLKLDIDEILSFRKEIEKLKIFIKNEVDIDTFNVKVFKFIDAYKNYINLNGEFEDTIDAFEIDGHLKWIEINGEFNSNYEIFIEVLNENIIKIENYITKILEIK
ncbi:hypothetical protein [Lysinibacillus sp. NPDC086135]|uniref:hypothetical protein n=1 Tax=Lysinibacillus sp. NPDC086135 TaxID=3364130 RepID=UPI00380E5059